MIFEFTVDPYKKLELTEKLQNFADGMEKATMDRTQEVLESARSRTAREMELNNASRLSSFYRAIGIDPATMEGTAETIKGGLYIDDTYAVSLDAFEVFQTEIGVVVKVDRFGTSTIVYPGAFGPEIPKLGRKIYKRITRNRLPIEKIVDIKPSKIPGLPEKVKGQTDEMRAELKEKLDRDKAKLVREWKLWHRQ